MKRTMAMAAAIVAWGASGAAGRMKQEEPGVTVRVYVRMVHPVNPNVMMVTIARVRASQLLADAGIRLEWRSGTPGEGETGPQVIALDFEADAPASFRDSPKALAAAKPYGKGTTISVFYDRVARYASPFRETDRPKVLGHVLAHEITHVLEGVARHSETGLMKASWTPWDLSEINRKGLAMAMEDRELIRARFLTSSLKSAVVE
jgi:hypothetical protein